jgi:hypothetical protein
MERTTGLTSSVSQITLALRILVHTYAISYHIEYFLLNSF